MGTILSLLRMTCFLICCLTCLGCESCANGQERVCGVDWLASTWHYKLCKNHFHVTSDMEHGHVSQCGTIDMRHTMKWRSFSFLSFWLCSNEILFVYTLNSNEMRHTMKWRSFSFLSFWLCSNEILFVYTLSEVHHQAWYHLLVARETIDLWKFQVLV